MDDIDALALLFLFFVQRDLKDKLCEKHMNHLFIKSNDFYIFKLKFFTLFFSI